VLGFSMNTLILIPSLLVFVVATYSGFRIVLWFLNISQDANRRSIWLTGIFLGAQIVCGGLFFILGIPEISFIAAMIMFGLIVRKFLVLEIWQMILIPIFVSFVSAILTAISLMILFKGLSS
jgi:hypothetical protein